MFLFCYIGNGFYGIAINVVVQFAKKQVSNIRLFNCICIWAEEITRKKLIFIAYFIFFLYNPYYILTFDLWKIT